MLENLREGVPAGKFRVIRIDQLSDKEFLIKDCDRNEAFEIADEYNKTRICVSQDVYYVYDDERNRGRLTIRCRRPATHATALAEKTLQCLPCWSCFLLCFALDHSSII